MVKFNCGGVSVRDVKDRSLDWRSSDYENYEQYVFIQELTTLNGFPSLKHYHERTINFHEEFRSRMMCTTDTLNQEYVL